MHILQHRDAQHAVKGVDADLAVGPVMHRSPTEPLSVFQAAEDARAGAQTRPDRNQTGAAMGHREVAIDSEVRLPDRKSTRLNSSHTVKSYAVYSFQLENEVI